MGTTAQKSTYLNTTKSQLKDIINYTGASITDDTFRQYPRKLYTQYLDILKEPDTLFNNMPKVEGTGTELTLNDTADTKMKLKLKSSELTQKTTKGKNLFDINGSLYSGSIDKINNGFRLTNNATYRTLSILFPQELPAGTYKITYIPKNSTVSNINRVMGSLRTANSQVESFILNNNNEVIVSPSQASDRIYVYIYADEASDVTITLDDFMISTSGGDYEPYTGGMSQPNPKFPSEVQVIKGNNSIKIENKNFFDESVLDGYKNSDDGESYIFDNNKLYNKNLTPNIKFKKNTSYTIQYIAKQVSGNPRLVIKYTDGSASAVGNVVVISTSLTKYISTSNPNKTIDYITEEFGTWAEKTFYIKKNSVCIVEGDDTTYVPHQEQVLPLNLPVENLFDKNSVTTGSYLNTAGNLEIDETAFYTDYYDIHNYTYITYSGSSVDGSNRRIIFYDKDKTRIDYYLTKNRTIDVSSANSIDRTKTPYYIRISDSIEYLNTIQLEPGDKANRYTPFGTTPIEYCKTGDYEDEFMKPSGKNKFDVQKWVNSGNNSNYYSYSNGTLSINSVDTRTMTNFTEQDRIYLPNGTYYLSNIGNAGIRVYNDNTDANVISTNQFNVTLGYIYLKLVSNSVMTCNPMINDGTTALPYEPYGKNKLYLKKNIIKVVFDGSETWTHDTGGSFNRFSTSLQNAFVGTGRQICLSNYFTNNLTANADGICFTYMQNVYLYKNDITNTTDFKTWLSTHNTEIYYQLATPIYIEITDATLISQLNAIEKTLSYDKQTNMSQTNTGLPFRIKASAVRSLANIFVAESEVSNG